MVSDIKDSSSVFGFIPDSKITGRILRYGHLYNEKANKIIQMSDIYSDSKLKAECESDYKHLYTLKHRIDWSHIDNLSNSDLKPYLESEE